MRKGERDASPSRASLGLTQTEHLVKMQALVQQAWGRDSDGISDELSGDTQAGRKDLDSSEPSWSIWFNQWPVSHLPPPSFMEDRVLGGARSAFRRCSPPDHLPTPVHTESLEAPQTQLSVHAGPWPGGRPLAFLGQAP